MYKVIVTTITAPRVDIYLSDEIVDDPDGDTQLILCFEATPQNVSFDELREYILRKCESRWQEEMRTVLEQLCENMDELMLFEETKVKILWQAFDNI